MQVWKQTGRQPAQLAEQPRFPDEVQYLWEWYLDMKQGATITFSEIRHWAALRKVRLQQREIAALRRLEQEWSRSDA